MFPEGIELIVQCIKGFRVDVVEDSRLSCNVEEPTALALVDVSVQIYLRTPDVFLDWLFELVQA